MLADLDGMDHNKTWTTPEWKEYLTDALHDMYYSAYEDGYDEEDQSWWEDEEGWEDDWCNYDDYVDNSWFSNPREDNSQWYSGYGFVGHVVETDQPSYGFRYSTQAWTFMNEQEKPAACGTRVVGRQYTTT